MPSSYPTEIPKVPAIAEGTGDLQTDADRLLDQARQIEGQEAAAPFIATTEEAYNAALAEVIEEKQEQANQIEDRLEGMVEAQGARLQQMQSQAPGMLAMPGAKTRHQAQVAQAQATLQRLQNRLEMVREIRDGIHVQGTRIENIAAVKLEHREPQLSDDFAQMQEARRLHELHARAQQEKRDRTEHQSVSHHGGLSQRRSVTEDRNSSR